MQDRILLAADTRLRVERVRFHVATAVQWSPVYRAPSRRLVLPGSGALQFRSGNQSLLVDSLTAFGVDAAAAYQLKPEPQSDGGARLSVVVSEAAGVYANAGPSGRGHLNMNVDVNAKASAGANDPPSHQTLASNAWLLSPAALYQLRLQWRLLERGQASVEAISEMLAWMFRSALPAAPSDDESSTVLRARRFLLAQPGAARTMHDVADAAYSSAFHLARLFRCRTGLSLHQYRQRLRLAAALSALEAGERDLAGLAHELGFCSQSHFGTVFRREIGVSPVRARMALSR